MTPARPPTLRQRRLGTELRKLRLRAGLSSTAAAAQLGVQQTQMSMIESGRHSVSAQRVRSLALTYDCEDERLVQALANLTGGRVRGWWEEYHDLLPTVQAEIAETEQHASALRVAVVVNIPGLLQTHDYARANFRLSAPKLLPHEIEHRTSFRIKRQGILFREPPVPYTAIVHEAALRLGVGGPEVTRDQLSHLITMSERDNVTIRVVPFGRADFPVSGQPITYVHGSVFQLDSVIIDTEYGCDFLDAEAQLEKYRAVLDRTEQCSLPPGKSRDLISKIVKDL